MGPTLQASLKHSSQYCPARCSPRAVVHLGAVATCTTALFRPRVSLNLGGRLQVRLVQRSQRLFILERGLGLLEVIPRLVSIGNEGRGVEYDRLSGPVGMPPH